MADPLWITFDLKNIVQDYQFTTASLKSFIVQTEGRNLLSVRNQI